MTTLIATWHPTYAMFKNPYAWGEFKLDLDRFARAIQGKLRPGPSKLVINPRVEDVARVVSKTGYVTCDVEAGPHNSLEPWTAKFPGLARLRCVGLGNADWALSKKWGDGSGAVIQAIGNLLADPKVKKVGQNAIWYDWPLLKRYRLVANNIDDTRDMRRALSSTSRLGLKYMATLYDDAPPWAEEDEEDDEKLVFTSNWTDLLTYNAYDCVETARVYEGILAEEDWVTPRVQNLYRIHLQTSQIAAKMRHKGMWIDKAERQRLADELQETYKEREAEFLKAVGIPGFKCQPNHMKGLIFKRHEKGDIKRFSLDDPYDKKMWNEDMTSIKVDQSSLMLLYVDPGVPKELKELIDLYWAAQAAQKARSTFVTSKLIDRAIGYDGFLRPDWNSCGPNTGRWSCRNPNVMTLPKDTKEGSTRGELPNLRRMYAAPPGFIIIEADWAQQELRMMRAVSGDEVLGAALDAGDVYTEDAKAIFRLPATETKETIKKSARQAAKIGHLGFQYGAGTDALYMQMLETDRTLKYSMVELVHRGLKERYCQTVKYWEEEQERVRQTGYSETRILNRRRYYPREPPITEVSNYPIQGTAADMTTLAILELDAKMTKHIRKGWIMGQFHDAFLICVPDVPSVVQRGVSILREAMEKKYLINGREFHFPIDIKVGYSWADLKDLKE